LVPEDPPRLPGSDLKSESLVGLARLTEEHASKAEVVALGLKAVQPIRCLISRLQATVDLFGEFKEVVGMTLQVLSLLVRLKLLARVLVDRLQHDEPGFTLDYFLLPEQTLVDE
jgi:hypothetical protein